MGTSAIVALSRSSGLATEPEIGESSPGSPAGFCRESDTGFILHEMLRRAETTGVESASQDTLRTEWR